jgi:hypothetical protein
MGEFQIVAPCHSRAGGKGTRIKNVYNSLSHKGEKKYSKPKNSQIFAKLNVKAVVP